MGSKKYLKGCLKESPKKMPVRLPATLRPGQRIPMSRWAFLRQFLRQFLVPQAPAHRMMLPRPPEALPMESR